MKMNRAKNPLKAYKEQLGKARKRVVDPFLEKVTKIIAGARRVHPRDESEPEKRLGIAFKLFSDSIVKAALELRSILRRPLDRPAMLRLGGPWVASSMRRTNSPRLNFLPIRQPAARGAISAATSRSRQPCPKSS